MRVLSCLLFSCLAAAALAGEESKAPMMRVGAAAVDITPKPGTPMAGYYRFRAVEGVRDLLYAKAIVIEHDGSLAALAALDLVSTSRPVVEQARELIRQQSGITSERVLISAEPAARAENYQMITSGITSCLRSRNPSLVRA